MELEKKSSWVKYPIPRKINMVLIFYIYLYVITIFMSMISKLHPTEAERLGIELWAMR